MLCAEAEAKKITSSHSTPGEDPIASGGHVFRTSATNTGHFKVDIYWKLF